MKNLIFTLILSLIFFSCQDKSDTTKESNKDVEIIINSNPPEIILTTPDQAVMSYIKYTQWKALTMLNLRKQFTEEQRSNLDVFFSGDYPDSLKSSSEYIQRSYDYLVKKNRTIEDVKTLSDSRAKVMVLTEDDTFGIYGNKVKIVQRYSLVKSDDKWIIEQIENTCDLCDGTGKITDYDYSIRKIIKQCETCMGTGWTTYEGAAIWQ